MFDETPVNDSSERVVSEAEAPSPAPVARFISCRWHKPADSGQPAHCTQREVLSMAGVHGFSPDAWCMDCRHFKLRRVPRKPGPA